MINPVYDISNYEGNDFEDFLKKANLFIVFSPLFLDEELNSYAVSIAKFIAWGWGMDSNMLSTDGNTWNKVREQIFEKANLPEELHEAVADMKSETVLKCIQKFLDYQNDENWIQYATFRDLRGQMLSSAIGDIKTANGTETNYEQKMKNAIHSQTLLEMMNNAKETFIQNHSKLRGSVEAMNKAADKKTQTRSVASYAKN